MFVPLSFVVAEWLISWGIKHLFYVPCSFQIWSSRHLLKSLLVAFRWGTVHWWCYICDSSAFEWVDLPHSSCSLLWQNSYVSPGCLQKTSVSFSRRRHCNSSLFLTSPQTLVCFFWEQSNYWTYSHGLTWEDAQASDNRGGGRLGLAFRVLGTPWTQWGDLQVGVLPELTGGLHAEVLKQKEELCPLDILLGFLNFVLTPSSYGGPTSELYYWREKGFSIHDPHNWDSWACMDHFAPPS